MANSLATYLWSHRKRNRLLTKEWAKSWLKRIHLLSHFWSQLVVVSRLRNSGAQIGELAFIGKKANIQGCLSKLSIGKETFVGEANLAVHDELRIGNRVCINDGAKLLTASHDVNALDWKSISSPIIVEDYVWIATDAIVLPGVTIGSGSVVGAGAVIAKDVAPNSIVVGNPARTLTNQRASELDYSPVSHIALFRAWLS